MEKKAQADGALAHGDGYRRSYKSGGQNHV